jgi:tetratricopeptide (TPR) repeat protein
MFACSDRYRPAVGYSSARPPWLILTLLVLFGWPFGWSAVALADDAANPANRQFIQAMQLIRQANATYDPTEESRLLSEADRLLQDIITRFPDTDLAVQLVTNQFVGDFDFFEFRNRVKSMVCNDQLSSKCFLFRIGTLLPPVEMPITTARWDWLSLAVAYHLFGDSGRAREIIAPFLSAVRHGAASEGGDRDLFVGRALALTDQSALALDLTRHISDCSTRLYNLADVAEVALWHKDHDQAVALALEARDYAAAQGCTVELGLVARTLFDTGQDTEAKALFASTVEQQFGHGKDAKSECCSPELAVAAGDLGDAAMALAMLRTVQDENPWTIAAVLGRLVRRGEVSQVLAYADQVQDVDNRGETYAELIAAFLERNDRATAEELMTRLDKLVSDDGNRRPALIAHHARAEKLMYNDDRWRGTFQQAITAAEHASSFVRRDIGGPLVAVLVKIETGRPLLD